MEPTSATSKQGQGVQLLFSVPVRDVRSLVPPEMKLVSIWPRRTLALVAFGRYEAGAIPAHDELIIAPALVRHEGRLGLWVSEIFVSNPAMVHAKRDHVDPPKHLAEFSWRDDGKIGEVSAQFHGHPLCQVTVDRRWWMVRKSSRFLAYSRDGRHLMRLEGQVSGRLGWGRGRWEVPTPTPMIPMKLRPLAALWWSDFRWANAPWQSAGLTSLLPLPTMAVQPAGAMALVS